MIYFDFNSTSIWRGAGQDFNPSSPHTVGLKVSGEFRSIRENLFQSLCCLEGKLIFNSGATESINSVLHSKTLKKNNLNGVISFAGEHSVTLACLHDLQPEFPASKILNIDKHSHPDLVSLEQKLASSASGSFLVSVLCVNNETGVITDLKAVKAICDKYKAILHIDAAQGLGKIPIDISDVDPDFMSFSGHKIGAQKGTGMLYIKDISKFVPLILGGGQEFGLRSGTSNYPGARSILEAFQRIDFNKNKNVENIRDYFEAEVLKMDERFFVNGAGVPRVYNTTNICFDGINNNQLLLALSDKEIYVSTGSACSSGSMKPSHVLMAMGLTEEQANSSLRFSLGPDTTKEEIDYTLEVLRDLTSRFLP